MRIAVYVNDMDVVVRAELFNESVGSAVPATEGLRLRVVSESVITDRNGHRVDLKTFFSNPSSFVCGDDGLVKQVPSRADTSVIPNLDMSVPFAFHRANTVNNHSVL